MREIWLIIFGLFGLFGYLGPACKICDFPEVAHYDPAVKGTKDGPCLKFQKPWKETKPRYLWLRICWIFNNRGTSCTTCGFSELAHYDHTVEWDVDDYPCNEFNLEEKK